MTLKKLPIGIQTFSKLREGNYLYVDKTKILHQLTAQEGAYFLSRPRRFGKSMLISTLHALYEGRKELFEGLYIYDKWDWGKTYPVIRIDFAGGTIDNREQLDKQLSELLSFYQKQFGIVCEASSIAGCFREIIIKLHEKYGQKVIILIDEYDKPILDQILHRDLADQIREGLKNLYSVMKAQDEHIQFIFMTGVTKFSKVSLFSGINQIADITLNPDYATICGYTHQDLESLFADHLVGVDMNRLRAWYNGYNFLGERVYNPYDIPLFIHEQHNFRSYWVETGGASFLIKLFREQYYYLPQLTHLVVGEEILNSFEIEQINPITLLFQTGYLTIDSTSIDFNDETQYKLRVPNKEVKLALHRHLIDAYTHREAQERGQVAHLLHEYLSVGDLAQVEILLKGFFAAIPWRNFTHANLNEYEGYYASLLYAFFNLINAQLIPEDISNHGQADLTIILNDKVYIMEIKLDKTERYRKKRVNPALKQIQDRQYSKKYIGQGKQVFEVGMIFNQTARNLVQMNSLISDV